MAQSTHLQGKASLAIVSLATFLALVVFTAPLTTLEAMTVAFAMSADQQAWVMSGMPLGAACGLLTAGALGDTLGRRKTFAAGLWITALSSLGAAIAPNGVVLILMRVIQGLGSAAIMACGLGYSVRSIGMKLGGARPLSGQHLSEPALPLGQSLPHCCFLWRIGRVFIG